MNMPPDALPVVQLPELVKLDAFTLAGPVRRFDNETKSGIPDLWPALLDALPFKGQVPDRVSYGAMWSFDPSVGSFMYLAGVGVEPGAGLPAGFETRDIPASSYLVFQIKLDGSALHPQVRDAMAVIWGQMVPTSGHVVRGTPNFERYDGRFAIDQPGAVIDFYVPVEA